MGKYLIVNADDFGLSEAINYGILKAHKEGIVTSTTIMANMPAFDHAIALAKKNPELHLGVHLTLTAYKPILDSHIYIVNKEGYFRKQSEIDTIDTNEAYRELKAQIDKVLATGLKVDHLDSHHHIHTRPVLRSVMERLSTEYKLPFRGSITSYKKHTKITSNVAYYEKGVSVESFENIVKNIKDEEIIDLMCHPGYIDYFLCFVSSYIMKRVIELEMLCSKDILNIIKEHQITLTNYAAL